MAPSVAAQSDLMEPTALNGVVLQDFTDEFDLRFGTVSVVDDGVRGIRPKPLVIVRMDRILECRQRR